MGILASGRCDRRGYRWRDIANLKIAILVALVLLLCGCDVLQGRGLGDCDIKRNYNADGSLVGEQIGCNVATPNAPDKAGYLQIGRRNISIGTGKTHAALASINAMAGPTTLFGLALITIGVLSLAVRYGALAILTGPLAILLGDIPRNASYLFVVGGVLVISLPVLLERYSLYLFAGIAAGAVYWFYEWQRNNTERKKHEATATQ